MIAFTAALLALCGDASAVDLVVWHAYRGSEREALEQAAASYRADTGVVVNPIALPFGAFDSKLETAVPRGNGPDLFISGHANLGKWVSMGVVEPLTDGLPLDLHRQVAADAVRWDGRVWGAPLAVKSIMLLYDPSKVDTPPTTTDELLAQARALTKGQQFGLAYQAAEPYFHAAWLHGFGGETIGVDGVALDGEAHVAALTFAERLAVREGVVPQQPTGELVSRLYREGNVAFVISGPWFVADMDRPIAAAPLPVVSETGLPARPFLTVEAAFIAKGTPRVAESLAFARYLSDGPGAAVREAVGRQALSLRAASPTDPLLRAQLAQADQAVAMPADPDVQNVFEAQARALRTVFRGASTPQLASKDAQLYYQILARPVPPPVSAWPYAAVAALALLGLLAWAGQPLADAAFRARLRAHWRDYLWIGPAGLAMSVLVVLPFVTGATVSLFAHYRGEWTFVGLQHFADILLSRDWPVTSPLSFFFTLGVTVLWTVTNLTLHVGLGIGLALVLREPWIRLRGLWRALLIIPWAVPNYITALIWKGMFHAQYGAINALVGAVLMRDGPVQIDWFGSFAMAFSANLATNTWLGFPFMMVVTLGALQSIPRDLEEAAEVDGASWWFRFRHVVWPLLQPALLPAVILGSVWTFNMFNVVYLVSAGEPDSSTEILISEAYRWAFSRGNRYGYAAAYAVLIFGVLLAYSRVANKLVGRRVL